jgi:hypothetical protein
MFFRIKPSVNVILPAIVLGFSLLAQAAGPILCSNATLRGDYSFSISGDVQPPSGPAIKVHGVALTHFDGQGNIVNSDHLVRNGTPPPVDWRPGTGSYLVHENCTGEAHINTEGSPTLDLYFVIGERGHEIRAVVSDAGANISANGLRVHASF